MAQHITGRRPEGLECDQEANNCRLIHQEDDVVERLDCFDRGINFTCHVLEEYITKHGFTSDQLLQIIATLQKKVGNSNEN
jgi:hypothetical protein